MQSISLTSLANEKLAEARQTPSGRAAHTIHGGHTHQLRQTVLALVAGREPPRIVNGKRQRSRPIRSSNSIAVPL